MDGITCIIGIAKGIRITCITHIDGMQLMWRHGQT